MAKLFLYNTLSRKKDEFRPIKKNRAGFYHCGPTVYWTQHIGNLRGMLCADILVRTLKYLGYKTTHVRNYTDVGHLTSDQDAGEDKMEKASRREGKSPEEIADKYIKIFENDTDALNILSPDKKPRATKYIREMIDMAKVLLKKGYAYETDLAVYFDVTKFEGYGRLSGQKMEDKKHGAGAGEITDPRKKNPADFALWFFKAGDHKNHLQSWSSPFHSALAEKGEGFPGWHIECSAMAKKLLGPTIDIHMGGIEHIPVHHTNEIAQSEASNGVKFVNYWIHNNHLLVNDRKMAKSEGTGYSLDEIKEKGFLPLALRYFFLQAHYRSKQNFTWQALGAAQNGLNRIYTEVREMAKTVKKTGKINEKFKVKFEEALADDLNSPKALTVLEALIKAKIPAEEKLATVLDFDEVLGLGFSQAVKNTDNIEIPEEVKKLAAEREEARKNKNWNKSDELRDKISGLGYLVEDTSAGPRIIKK